VTLGGKPCVNVTLLEPHVALRCESPPGQGAELPIAITVAGQVSALSNLISTFRYELPAVASVAPFSSPSKGGVRTNVTGANLGLDPAVVEVTVGGKACVDVAMATPHRMVTCTVPPGEGCAQTVSVRVAGQAMAAQGSDAEVSLAYVPPPPALTTAVMGDTGGFLSLHFSKPSDQGGGRNLADLPGVSECAAAHAGSSTCCMLLATATVAKLGAGASCFWLDASTLAVSLSTGATVVPGHAIELRPGGLAQEAVCARATATEFSSGAAPLAAPLRPPVPIVQIRTPSAVSACDNLAVDGADTRGGGGRALSYSWQASGETQGLTDRVRSLLAGQKTTSSIAFNGENLDAGVYNFTLTATNFLQQSTAGYAVVERSSRPIPSIVVEGAAARAVRMSDGVTLRGEAMFSACWTESKAMDLRWTADQSPGLLDAVTTTGATLVIPPANLKKLGLMTHALKLTGTMKVDATVSAQADASVVVTSSPLTAAIAGGDRSEANSLNLTLDAGTSVDPDALDGVGTPAGFLYQWACTSPATVCDALAALATTAAAAGTGTAPTVPALGTEARGASQLVIRNNTLPANVSVVFTVQVRRTTAEDARAAAAVTIFTREGAVLKVSVNPGSGTVNAGTDIRLRAAATGAPAGSPATTYAWSVVSASTFDLTDPALATMDGANLLITSTALVPGQLYTVRVDASAGDASSGFASSTLRANVPPAGGSFEISPASGEALTTKFTLKSMGWVDTDVPVVYTFVYMDPNTGAETPIGVDKRDSGTLSDVTLPAGLVANNFTLVVKAYVFDSIGASTHLVRTVVVWDPAPAEGQSMSDFVANAASSLLTTSMATGNTASAIDLIMQLNAALAGGTAAAAAASGRRLLLLHAINNDDDDHHDHRRALLQTANAGVTVWRSLLDSYFSVAASAVPQASAATVSKLAQALAGLAGSAGSDGYTLGMQRAGLAANISVAMLRRCEAVAAIDATARNAVARVMDAAVAEASSAVQGQTDVDDTVLVQRQIWSAAEESATIMSRVALLGRLPSEVGLYSCSIQLLTHSLKKHLVFNT
jgi:hypothetical protein